MEELNISDKIVKEIFDAVDIIVSQRIRDTNYTHTINCQVKERIKNSDTYVLLYQNEELTASSMGASYNKGDKVIVLLPDKNFNSSRFILGRTNDRTPTIVPNQNGELSPEILKEIQDALNTIAELSSDNIVSPSEKTNLSIQWSNLTNTYQAVLRDAVNRGVDTTLLATSYLSLSEMVSTILENMNVSTNIVGAELRKRFQDYYTDEKSVRLKILTVQNELEESFKESLVIINELTSDDIISSSEKTTLSLQWSNLSATYQSLIEEAKNKGVDSTALEAEYAQLKVKIDAILADMTTSSSVSGVQFRQDFNNYYSKEQALRLAISKVAPEVDIELGVQNLLSNAGFSGGSIQNWENSVDLGTISVISDLNILKYAIYQTTNKTDISQYVTFSDEPREGEKYTLSFYIKRMSGALTSVTAELFGATVTHDFVAEDPLNKWTRIKMTITAPVDHVGTQHNLRFYTNEAPGEHYITGFQLERGTIMTDFKYNNREIGDRLEEGEKDISDLKDATDDNRIIELVTLSDSFKGAFADVPKFDDLNPIKDKVDGMQQQTKDYVSQTLQGYTKVSKMQAEIEKATNAIKFDFSMGAGINLIKNSTGFFEEDDWTITSGTKETFQTMATQEIEQKAIGSAFYLSDATVADQNIIVKPDTDYSFTYWLKKPSVGVAYVKLYKGPNETDLIATVGPPNSETVPNFVAPYVYKFRTGPDQKNLRIEMNAGAGVGPLFSGLMLNEGSVALQWSSHSQEIANTNIRFNLNGIRVNGAEGSSLNYTQITPKEFAGYANVIDETGNISEQRIFTLNGETTEVYKLNAKNSVQIGDGVFIRLSGEKNGIALFM